MAMLALASAAPLSAQTTPEELHERLQRTYPHNVVEDPEVERRQFLVHPNFEVNLFAASPWVVNPIAMSWDPEGRLWVINGPTYPHILPGQKQTDFISVLEDTDDDGRADKCTIFYDKLYVPTGIELGDGGAYVANQPDLLFLKDNDGDLQADSRTVLLSGFGTEDNHHAISAFVWGPGGYLYFQSGIFLHTQVETPHGVVRLDNGGVFQLRPRTLELGLFNVGTATNPWGHAFDKWGQSFLTEGPQGDIWYLTPGTVSSHPEQRVPGTEAPKACGNEFIYSRHFSEELQGKMVLNAFKNKTVNLYEFSDDGAGYATKELQPHLIVSKEQNFRPVDVEIGPDGAIYVADFFQQVIGHMQYEFRDPRRDHRNGRIWRITQKGRNPLPKPRLVSLSPDQLAENLKSPDAFVRDKSRRLLYEREQSAADEALRRYMDRLDPRDEEYEHHRLEALWAYQTIDLVQPELLRAVLESSESRARAAAVRVLRYWRNEVPDALALMSRAAGDSHPRVRLEAVCALSYIPDARAMQAAAKIADWPMDRFLEYSFKHTAVALKEHWLPALEAGKIDFGGNPHRMQAALSAVGAKGAVSLLLEMLATGQIAPDRRESVLLVVAGLGSAKELSRIFDRRQLEDFLTQGGGAGYDPAVHARVLAALARARRQRNVRPDVEPEQLAALIATDDLSLRVEALRLAGAWKMQALRDELAEAARNQSAPPTVRVAAMEGLAELGGRPSAALLEELVDAREPLELRCRAVAGLARIDVNAAASRAAQLLTQPPKGARPDDMLDAVLSQKGGGDRLAAAMAQAPLDVDSAKLALRHLNATGQQHPGLIGRLREVVGTGTLTSQLAAEDVRQLVEEIETRGNPYRGEEVFRRKDLACLSCHAIAGGGPPVGPDLEGIGASSPVDYLVYAVLDPNKAVREGYAAVTVLTDEGRVHTGILKGRTPEELVILNPTTRELQQFSADSIEQTVPAQSVMPKGLIDNMTRSEFIDLIRFLHELGRPGPFATPNIPLLRTWRVLRSVPPGLAGLPADEVPSRLGREYGLPWQAAYTNTSGELPLDELGDGPVAFVLSKIEVGTPGRLQLALNSPEGLQLWVDGKRFSVSDRTTIDVGRGVRQLLFRVALEQREGEGLRVLLEELPDSPARARPVAGL